MEARNGNSKRVLVLSGGGGRGAYHIGVLEYLEEVGWRPALDAMLTETVWRDYLLYKMEREAGRYPDLKWLEIVAPDHYLTVGLMTHYQVEYHQQLFQLGYRDARKDLAQTLPLPEAP